MLQRVLNAFLQCGAYALHHFEAEVPPNSISAEWQRKAGHVAPPFTAIENFLQSSLTVGELSFMNDEASFILSFEDLRNDLIEGNHFCFHVRSKKLQREVSSRQLARHC